MNSEKKKDFKVTDKRAAFHEEESSETSQAQSIPLEEPKQESKTRQDSDASSNPFPDANFMTLVVSLAFPAQVLLGLIPDPVTQETHKDLPQAKYHIDLLGVLLEKTKGNLTAEEEKTLDQIVADLRMVYIQLNKQE